MSNFILKFLFRTFSCLFLACCVFVTFVPLKDMTTLIKEKKPLWMIKMSQVWGGSVSVGVGSVGLVVGSVSGATVGFGSVGFGCVGFGAGFVSG